MTSPSLETTPRTWTEAEHLLLPITGTSLGSSASHRSFFQLILGSTTNIFSSEKNLRCPAASCFKDQEQTRSSHRGNLLAFVASLRSCRIFKLVAEVLVNGSSNCHFTNCKLMASLLIGTPGSSSIIVCNARLMSSDLAVRSRL